MNPSDGVVRSDLIAEVYERYRYLDQLLSDAEWLPRKLQAQMLRECWLAVKQTHDARLPTATDVCGILKE